MIRVAIALGSNLGNRQQNIENAITELRNISLADQPFLIADILDTEPDNCPPDSPRFLNTAVDLAYHGDDPLKLLDITQAIERKLGREPNPTRNAPRLIDIDILLFGHIAFEHPRITLPHPRIRERPFVHIPLKQIRPDF